MRILVLAAALLAGGCATSPTDAITQCGHTPGCVKTTNTVAYGPPHAVVAAPEGPGAVPQRR